jgi:hypothetical protein
LAEHKKASEDALGEYVSMIDSSNAGRKVYQKAVAGNDKAKVEEIKPQLEEFLKNLAAAK